MRQHRSYDCNCYIDSGKVIVNIGIVTAWLECGAGYVSRSYMRVLQQHGHNVGIYVRGWCGHYDPHPDPIWDMPEVTWGIRYKPLGRVSRFDEQYVNMLHFETWLRQNDIEVIITNEDHGFDLAKRAKRLGYIIGTYIDYYTHDTIQQFGVYDFLLCNTKRHYSVFRNHDNCYYVPWGTDIDTFRPQPRSARDTDDEAVVFFHSAGVGGMNLRKGTDLLVQAFRNVTGNARLIVHSIVPMTRYGKEVMDIINRDNRIQFIEKIVSAPGLYHLGDVFVYPSRLEGIGLCIPEALACGLPVITTDNAPMNEFVEHGVNGSLVRVNKTTMTPYGYYWPETIVDLDCLTRAMQAYVDDRGLLYLQQARARESAENRLNWMKNASDLGDKLVDLRNRSRRKRREHRVNESIAWWSEAKYVAFLTCVNRIKGRVLRRVTSKQSRAVRVKVCSASVGN